MRIGELADRLGVNPKTIRYYEDIGLLAPPARTPAGYRVYGEDHVELISFIKAAQRLSLRLDEIREIIAFRERGEKPCGYVRDVLRREVAEIDGRIAELQRLRGELVALDRLADELPESDAPDSDPCPLIGRV
ncbi:MAG: MerR family transcriptional regulator [Streptosporangiales bacterium]|nr:MerR family transcriptional regulator [Streptosporangiales bacterium]